MKEKNEKMIVMNTVGVEIRTRYLYYYPVGNMLPITPYDLVGVLGFYHTIVLGRYV